MLQMVTPVNSVMAADVSGAIALFPTGKLPKRKGHLGTFPAPAWLAAYDWAGSVPPEDMPIFVDPPEGFFAHGNNLMFDPARSAVHLQIDSAPAYRLERIGQLIGERNPVSVQDMQAMQLDVLLLRAKRILPAMLADLAGLRGFLPREDTALALLQAWDGRAGADSPAAAVFFTTYREALIAAMADEVDPHALSYLLSERYFSNAVDLWYDSADHPVWDDRSTPAVERRGDIVRAAYRKAILFLRETLGSDPQAWRWGALHDQHSKHAFGSKLEAFNLPRWEAQGGPDAVWKSHLDLGNLAHPFRAVAGPVYRMVVDLADLDHGWWILDTGASGWPGSDHYGDQFELWKAGRLAPMLMNWAEIRAQAKAVISLQPKAR
jgi:penicillin amidase